MGELPTYRVAVRARKEPAGTYTYVITRIDDPNWAERTGESYSTPEAASEAGWIALDRIRAVKKLDRSAQTSPRSCATVRIHKTLRTTPAMAARVTERLWEIGDIVNVLEAWEAAK
jgi:hypothetical protein